MFLSDELIILASTGYIGGKFLPSFKKDLLRLKIIKRQLSRYTRNKKINLRLFINNLILFFNCFDTHIGKILIYHYIQDEIQRSVIKTCLLYINLILEEEWIEIELDPFFEELMKELIS